MPVLPQYEQSLTPQAVTQYNTPRINNPLVGVAANVGESLKKYAEETRQRDNDFWTVSTALSMQSQWAQELQAEEEAGNWQGAGDRLLTRFSEQAADALANAPSADARAALAIQLQRARAETAGRIADFEYRGKVKNAITVSEAALNDARNDVITNPQNADRRLLEANALIELSPLTPDQKIIAVQKNTQQIRSTQFLSVLARDPNQAEQLLNSPEFSGQLDADTRLQFIQQVRNSRERQQDYSKQVAIKAAADARALANLTGNEADVRRAAEATARANSFVANPAQRAENFEKVIELTNEAAIYKQFKTQPAAVVEKFLNYKYVPEPGEPAGQAVAKSAAVSRAQERLQSELAQRENNPVTAILELYPELGVKRRRVEDIKDPGARQLALQEYYAEVTNAQRQLGMPPQLLDTAEAQRLANSLKSATNNPTQTAITLNQLQREYGVDNFPILAEQLVKKANLPKDIYMAFIARDVDTAAVIVDAYRSKTVNAVGKLNTSERTNLEAKVEEKLKAFNTSYNAFGETAVAQKEGAREAMRNVALREVERGANTREAVDTAAATVLDKTYQFVSPSTFGLQTDGTVRLPRSLNLGGKDVAVEPGVIVSNINRYAVSQLTIDNLAGVSDKATLQAVKDNLIVTTSGDDTGIVFMFRGRDGRVSPLMRKDMTPLVVPISEFLTSGFAKDPQNEEEPIFETPGRF
jgi:hypothetical protein